MSIREQLVKLKQDAWDAEDWQTVKRVRNEIKAYDAAHTPTAKSEYPSLEELLGVGRDRATQ